MPEADLPARWESGEWLAGLEAWLLPALDAVGLRTTSPVVRDRVRFWSVVARVETDAGRVWVKENPVGLRGRARRGRRRPGAGCRGHSARDRRRPRLAGHRRPRPADVARRGRSPAPGLGRRRAAVCRGAAGAHRPCRRGARDRRADLPRAESWRRLQADVPVTRVDEPFLRSAPEWLADAAAPDPYASAVAR